MTWADQTFPYRPCVGCSFCCRQARCILGAKLHGPGRDCPSLVQQDGRWWCGEVLKDAHLKESLAIGAGCSSTLFNSLRYEMLRRNRP